MKQRAIMKKVSFATVLIAAAFSVHCSSSNNSPGGNTGQIVDLADGGACGGVICKLPSWVTNGTACCISALDGKCGVATPSPFGGAAMCGAIPPMPNTSCQAASFGPIMGTPCCTSDGKCGQSGMFIQGCTDNATLASEISGVGTMGPPPGVDAGMFAGFMATIPPPSSCTP